MNIIRQITDVIERVEGVKLLDVDPGKATNRTVVTFVGEPEQVIQAAADAIGKAAELIDMSKHTGEHPRMGATDVCPLVPVSGITMQETVEWAHKLGEIVGERYDIPFYMYESAATRPDRRNLATVRAGEYEALPEKLAKAEWRPDYGPAKFNPRAGATAIGARDFLIAYNINLNTTSVRRANSVAFDVREKGRVKRKGDPITGEIITNEQGEAERIPGELKSVKGIGWYIEEYGLAQVSMNLTDINETPLHICFEACRASATRRGMRVTGSELVGLVPLRVMTDAGRYFLEQQRRSTGVSERELIKIAVKSMGLDDLTPFDPDKKIIEYRLDHYDERPLADMTLTHFANETASESPAPGGGSIAAYLGTLGASLATMVANLSSHKRGWDDRWQEYSNWAAEGQLLKDELLRAVDADTEAFNNIMAAFRMPKGSDEEKTLRKQAIQDATKGAIEVPMHVMELSLSSFVLIKAMAETGLPSSVSDAGVAALCARAAVIGAYLNVKINAGGLTDTEYRDRVLKRGQKMVKRAKKVEKEVLGIVHGVIDG